MKMSWWKRLEQRSCEDPNCPPARRWWWAHGGVETRAPRVSLQTAFRVFGAGAGYLKVGLLCGSWIGNQEVPARVLRSHAAGAPDCDTAWSRWLSFIPVKGKEPLELDWARGNRLSWHINYIKTGYHLTAPLHACNTNIAPESSVISEFKAVRTSFQ